MKHLKTAAVLVLTFCSLSAHAIKWKGVFISGDDSIDNFDNGRIELTRMFSARGTLEHYQLSSSAKFISKNESVYEATGGNIGAVFGALNIKKGEGCLIHMTSHGRKENPGGFYLSRAGIWTPDDFASLVNETCGKAPTVILVSACYSGQFITKDLEGPNRVILTAAIKDRPSFGCSADTTYTYWDGCMIEQLPNSKTWSQLYENVNACVTKLEDALGAPPSLPQSSLGKNTKNWEILH